MADSPARIYGEELGLGKRMIGVFVSPCTTFRSVRSRVGHADWLVPIILMTIVTVITVYLTLSITMAHLEKISATGGMIALASALVSPVLGLFLNSAIFLGIVRFILGGETTYKHMLAVNSLSMLVGIPAAIVTVPLILYKGSLIQVGLGLFLPDSMTGTFLGHLLSNLGFFSIWQYALVAIGLGIVSGISTKKSAIGVFTVFFLYALVSAGSQELTERFTPTSARPLARPLTHPEEVVVIPDANLRAVIADSLGKASSETITAGEMATLPRLDAPNKGVQDLAGLEFATNLTRLDLGSEKVNGKYVNSNEISDLSPLSNLTRLRFLSLHSNSISDVSPLSGLTRLITLSLHHNSISDVSPLSGLTNLTMLNLYDNSISDVSPLSDLTRLKVLMLSKNSISDVSPLSGLTRLRSLMLHHNSISDVSPLSDLTGLSLLQLAHNNISDVSPLSDLTSLKYLYLYNNSISDLASLVANTRLSNGDMVNVRNNPLSTTSLNTHIPALQGREVEVRFSTSK